MEDLYFDEADEAELSMCLSRDICTLEDSYFDEADKAELSMRCSRDICTLEDLYFDEAVYVMRRSRDIHTL